MDSPSGKLEYQFQREVQNFVKSKWIKSSILVRQITFLIVFHDSSSLLPNIRNYLRFGTLKVRTENMSLLDLSDGMVGK